MKKNFLKAGVALTMVSALVLGSCGKYEEGPGLSLRTKKARLTGVWDEKEYVSSNGTVTADTDNETAEFLKDGSLKYVDGSETLNGSWALINDKKSLEITVNIDLFGTTLTVKDTSEIIRLTNKEFWTKDSDGDIYKSEKVK